jgi:hypothetical protein
MSCRREKAMALWRYSTRPWPEMLLQTGARLNLRVCMFSGVPSLSAVPFVASVQVNGDHRVDDVGGA